MSVSQQKAERYDYDADNDIESRQGLLSNGELKSRVLNHVSRRRTPRWSVVLTLLNLTLFGATAIMLFKLKPHLTEPARPVNAPLLETSVYSPVLHDMELNIVDTIMNGSVWRKLDTPWNGEPEDSVKEAVWDDFNDIRILALTSEQIIKMGKDPAISATLDDAHWHAGEGKYVGGLDIFHQIHCLNHVRKAALKGGAHGTVVNGTARLHTIHCIDMLMQHLLCTGDTGLITYNWYEGVELPQPNFSVHRKCIDWRQLVEYRDAHALPKELWLSYVNPPAGDRAIPTGSI